MGNYAAGDVIRCFAELSYNGQSQFGNVFHWQVDGAASGGTDAEFNTGAGAWLETIYGHIDGYMVNDALFEKLSTEAYLPYTIKAPLLQSVIGSQPAVQPIIQGQQPSAISQYSSLIGPMLSAAMTGWGGGQTTGVNMPANVRKILYP